MRFGIWLIVLVVGLCGCWKPSVLRITPGDTTPDEIKYVLSQLPEGFRTALPDTNPANATRLDLRVWAFDFEGGPFDMIIETIGAAAESSGLNFRNLGCEGQHGRMLVWLQPRESSRMDSELRDRFRANKPQVPNLAVGIDTNEESTLRANNFGNPNKLVVPLWYGWSEVDVKESTTPAILKVREVGTLLRVEATEKGVANPRKIILSFQAAKR